MTTPVNVKNRLVPWEPGVFIFNAAYRATYYSPTMLVVTKLTLETLQKAMGKDNSV